MKQLKKWWRNPILSGSLIMIVGSNLINLLNYVYHFALGRMLGPSNYGTLAALFSVLALLAILPAAFGLVIVKFIAASQDQREIAGLIKFFRKIVLVLGLIVILLMVVLTPNLEAFLKIDQPQLFWLMGVGFLISTLAFVNKSVLQGLVRFKEYVISGLVENSLKLGLGIGLVWWGYAVGGAMLGLVLAYVGGWLVSWWYIREFRVGEKLSVTKIKQLVGFTGPVLVQSIMMTSLYSSDIILVKHFFGPSQAGIYAAISALSRIILFASGPVNAVMFPWIAKRQAEGKSYWSFFNYSFGLTAIICAGVLGLYLLVPNLAIEWLYGSAYLAGSGLLIWFGLFMSLLTLSLLLINFFLSLGKTKVVILPAVAAVAQIGGIYWWHESLMSVVLVSVWVSAGLLTGLAAYLSYLKSAEDR